MKSAFLLTLLCGSSLAFPAAAADMNVKASGNVYIISISGQIEKGDGEKFQAIASNLPNNNSIVILESPGGKLGEGLQIGAIIRDKGWNTGVRNDAVCASSCGLIWLAGVTRLAGESSYIGFHAAYKGQDRSESGVGNALVGAYMTQLKYPLKAVVYVTSAEPNEMKWLSNVDAETVGITFRIVPNKDSDKKIASAPTPIQSFNTSTPTPQTQAFAPIQPPAPAASPPSAEQLYAATLPSYHEGRKARISYETWYGQLAIGPYREGVEYWAANRSLKPPPTCWIQNADPDWRNGCTAAKVFLTPVDSLRKSDKAYWWGWNSL